MKMEQLIEKYLVEKNTIDKLENFKKLSKKDLQFLASMVNYLGSPGPYMDTENVGWVMTPHMKNVITKAKKQASPETLKKVVNIEKTLFG